MPRHEIVVERLPQEFQGKPVRLPPPMEPPYIYTWTVAAFRASHPTLGQMCHSCDISFDMSSLEPVFDDWGPDDRITVTLSCMWQPGEPRPEPGATPDFLRARAKELRDADGPDPNAARE